ncbi:HD domain-containing protein [Megalodesulfovibrio gigas]|uniref:HD domain-containing protein n=1 Tax=Megalodesulfovibrio gigas TaxID=879 RepID=UPI0004169BC2|nr:HD domain-containing protein [Megalodesulfovibrio gigas]
MHETQSPILLDELQMLRQAGLGEKVIAHSERVTATALWLVDQLGEDVAVDRERVRRGAVFHDLGKVEDGGVLHGVVGARLGRALGLEEDVCRTMEVHVRGGVPAEEAARYGLPPGDYRPETLEQRLVVLADKLMDVVEAGKAASAAEALATLEGLLHRFPDLGKDAATTARILGLAEAFRAARRENERQPGEQAF